VFGDGRSNAKTQFPKIQDAVGRPPWEISKDHISSMGDPIHFVFGSSVGFSGSVDEMALLPVASKPRWWPAAILLKNLSWHNSDSIQDRDMISSFLVGFWGTGHLMVKLSFLKIKDGGWRPS